MISPSPRRFSPVAQAWSVYLLIVLIWPKSLVGQPSLPVVGTDHTLDVATWNLFWFGDPHRGPADDKLQLQNVARVIREMGIDVWALQEISAKQTFSSLLAELSPPYTGWLSEDQTWQRMAFVYDQRVVQSVRSVRHAQLPADPFAQRLPLILEETQVELADTTMRITFVNVHMKAFADSASYEQRRLAAQFLDQYLRSQWPGTAVIVLGDFNDRIWTSTYQNHPSPYTVFTAAADSYQFVTDSLEHAGRWSYCAWKSPDCSTGTHLFDHILITDELAPTYRPGSTRVLDHVREHLPDYRQTTSDHLPVMAQFGRSVTATGIPSAQIEPTAPIVSIWPNPARKEITVAFRLTTESMVSIVCRDLQGRTMPLLGPVWKSDGLQEVTVSVAALPAGIYGLQIHSKQQEWSRTFVKTR